MGVKPKASCYGIRIVETSGKKSGRQQIAGRLKRFGIGIGIGVEMLKKDIPR